MAIEMDPAWKHLAFMSPLSDSRAQRLARFVADGLGHGTVVDIGCGWGELLLRVAAAAPSCAGTGIDRDEDDITHARELAADRGVDERVTFIAGDATAWLPERADAVVCLGATHVWNPLDWNAPGVEPLPLDYRRALLAIRRLVPRGGRVAYGEAIWSAPPTPAALAPLSGREDELVTFAELVEIAVACDLMPLAFHEATLDEWDEFESGYSAPFVTWLAAHEPDHADAAEVRERARGQRNAHLGGYRNIMGMAYLELLAV